MAKVYQIQEPFTAYSFRVTETGTNIETLQAEVVADGGTIDLIAKDVVNIFTSNGGQITLPLGITAVIDEFNVRHLPNEEFDVKFTSAEDVDADDLAKLEQRIAELEAKANKKKAD